MLLKIINKLANLYFLKSFAMDVAQARQLLKVPEGASKAEIERAYKVRQHTVYLQTGQYGVPPEFDAAKNVLIGDLQKPEVENKTISVPENEQTQQVTKGVAETVYNDVVKYIDDNTEIYMNASGNGLSYSTAEMIRTIDSATKANDRFWAVVKFTYNDDKTPDIKIAEVNRIPGGNFRFMIGIEPSLVNVDFDEFKKFLEMFNDKTDDMDDDLIDYLNSYVNDVFVTGYYDRLEGVVNRHNLPASILERILLGYRKLAVPSSQIPVSLAKKMAAHQNATRLILSQLETHEHKAVREQVARNKNTGTDVLAYLSADSDFHVRLAVAANPNTTDNILNKLKDDVESGISSLAKGRLGIP